MLTALKGQDWNDREQNSHVCFAFSSDAHPAIRTRKITIAKIIWCSSTRLGCSRPRLRGMAIEKNFRE